MLIPNLMKGPKEDKRDNITAYCRICEENSLHIHTRYQRVNGYCEPIYQCSSCDNELFKKDLTSLLPNQTFPSPGNHSILTT